LIVDEKILSDYAEQIYIHIEKGPLSTENNGYWNIAQLLTKFRPDINSFQ